MPKAITLRVSLDGGGPAVGGVAATYGQTVTLSVASLAGVPSVRFLILGYPPGWSMPSGWTAAVDGDGKPPGSYYVDVANASTAPTFTLPADTVWGKWIFDAYSLTDSTVSNDTPSGVEIVSANGVHDIAPGETSQFSVQSYIPSLQADLRKLEAALAGGGGGGGSPTSGIVKVTFTYANAGTSIVTAHSAPTGAVGTFRYDVGPSDGSTFDADATLDISLRTGMITSPLITSAQTDLQTSGAVVLAGVYAIGGKLLVVDVSGSPTTGNGHVWLEWWIPSTDFPA